MRLGRLVAAGLVAGVVAGFVGALLRPRTVRTIQAEAGRETTMTRAPSPPEPTASTGTADLVATAGTTPGPGTSG